MKAGVLYAPHDFRVEDRPMPSAGDGDVLIQVQYNGLCGTDATEYTKGPMMVPLTTPHPNSKHVGPTILGHEFVGTVVEAGAGSRLAVGQRVACGAGISCGSCKWCAAGRTNLCEKYYTLGLNTHGGLAEFVAAPDRICIEVPEGLDMANAALAQPFAVGLHAVDRADLHGGETVVVLGCGAIGSFVIAALAVRGFEITAVDIDPARLAVAKSLGATTTHVITREMGDEDVAELLGAPADCVIETSGVPGAVQRAIRLVTRGGKVVIVGLNKSPDSLLLADVVLREISLASSVAHVCDRNLGESLQSLAQRPLAEILPVKVIDIEHVEAEGLQRIADGSAGGKLLVGFGS